MDYTLITFWVAFPLLAAYIAHRKGLPWIRALFLTIIVPPIGLLTVLFLSPKSSESKLDALIRIFLITAANIVIFYFLSFFTISGNDSGDEMRIVRIFGYLWIALFTLGGLIAWIRGNGARGATISASALPVAFIAAYTIIIGNALLSVKIG